MSASKRTEALLNEYKGNLYEFLTAQRLARVNGIESQFIQTLREDFFVMLSQQEAFIREYYPWLLEDLPILALGLGDQIQSELDSKIIKVEIVGKASASDKEGDVGEADLLVELENTKQALVSVKLSKTGAFVNTKSAGVKSFLGKYFRDCFEIDSIQKQFSDYFDKRYQTMAYELCDMAGVTPSESFDSWRDQGLSELPGELAHEFRQVFLNSLYDVSNKLFEHLESLSKIDSNLFTRCLFALLGYSRVDIIQATSFYKAKDQHYELDYHRVENGLGELSQNFIRLENRPRSSSFDIVFSDRILQIRL
ncbi:MAG: hypothetical protein KC478_11010, partial [Bacteriovoracaceae bacterium]|nr:hypothetical protein [Bacteriovoracaceae bacterium]